MDINGNKKEGFICSSVRGRDRHYVLSPNTLSLSADCAATHEMPEGKDRNSLYRFLRKI